MSSLKANFDELIQRIRQGRDLGHVSVEPIYYLVFPPREILEVKRSFPAWRSRLRNDGWDVHRFSIATEIADILGHAPQRKFWLTQDRKAPLNWDKTNDSLENAITDGSLLGRFETLLGPLEGQANAIVLVTDLEALHPYLRIGAIEGQLYGKFHVPTVFFYPGERYDKHGQALRHNTKLHDAKYYDADFDKTTFANLYPFLPAHFDTLLHLLGALAKSTGGIGLRSAIKIIQDILVEGPDDRTPVADQPVGWLATTVTLYDALEKDNGQQAVDALRTNNAFKVIGVALRDVRVPPDVLARAAERLTDLTGDTVIPLEDEISKATVKYLPQCQHRFGPLPFHRPCC